MFFVNNDVPDRDITAKMQSLEEQRQDYTKRHLKAMVDEEEEWVPKKWNATSLFLLWKVMNPLVDDPRVFRSIRCERNVLLPAPEWGTTLYEYVKEEKMTYTLWSLPERMVIECGMFKKLCWDEISRKSIKDFLSGELKRYVTERNNELLGRHGIQQLC